MCNKGITQFYLPPTHKPYLPLLPAGRHHPLAGTNLYCLVNRGNRCEKHAQSFYAACHGRDSNPRPLDRESDTLPTAPRRHLLLCLMVSITVHSSCTCLLTSLWEMWSLEKACMDRQLLLYPWSIRCRSYTAYRTYVVVSDLGPITVKWSIWDSQKILLQSLI